MSPGICLVTVIQVISYQTSELTGTELTRRFFGRVNCLVGTLNFTIFFILYSCHGLPLRGYLYGQAPNRLALTFILIVCPWDSIFMVES
jgi:hypothetical protein